MTKPRTASHQIIEEVTAWRGVVVGPGRRGELAFKVGRREIGHLHGDHAAHFGFPKQVWVELRAEGRIEPHPVFPDAQGPAARRIESEADVHDVIELLRLNYDRAMARQRGPRPDARRPSIRQDPFGSTTHRPLEGNEPGHTGLIPCLSSADQRGCGTMRM